MRKETFLINNIKHKVIVKGFFANAEVFGTLNPSVSN